MAAVRTVGDVLDARFDNLPVSYPVAEAADCNQNGLEDADDIPAGRSEDVNGDGIPDECQDLDVQEITVRSGDIGILARNNFISGPLAAPTVVEVHPAWSVIPGTAWLQPDATQDHSTCAIYETSFALPPGYRDSRRPPAERSRWSA